MILILMINTISCTYKNIVRMIFNEILLRFFTKIENNIIFILITNDNTNERFEGINVIILVKN